MNLTETEAKTKWCPFSPDPRPDVQSSCNCIASGCMAWKWGHEYTNNGQPMVMHSTEYGYCGLMK